LGTIVKLAVLQERFMISVFAKIIGIFLFGFCSIRLLKYYREFRDGESKLYKFWTETHPGYYQVMKIAIPMTLFGFILMVIVTIVSATAELYLLML